MAGGAGTRFWPESRKARPKQLLALAGDQTMIQQAVARLGNVVPGERVLVVTGRHLVESISAQLPDVPRERILAEPCKRDTAPCIGLAAVHLVRRDPDATMVVLPSDHVISPNEMFQHAIVAAGNLVDKNPQALVTFGIRPTFPAETFGYIERGAKYEEAPETLTVYRVNRFREKPAAAVAREYLAQGNFYWNAGIFIWKAASILDALGHHAPAIHEHLEAIGRSIGTQQYSEVLEREFSAIQGKSIDYAVMEHASDVLVAEAPFTWDDVGSWQAIARLNDSDPNGNTIQAKHLGIDTTGTIVRGSDDHLIVTLGLTDCIVVHTPDATLVARKDDEESIRQVVKLLEERGWNEYL
jgi:mannose-1-phosphate guanylyltransferase